ncbi:MAG: LPS export ABC transporter protein LptC [Alphaproteobacteria bacterium]
MNARTVKLIFLFLALGLTVLLFSWPSNDDKLNLSTRMDVEDNAEDTAPGNVSDVASTVMEFPNFTGEGNHRRWGVKADRAIQVKSDKSDKVRLEKVEAYSVAKNGESFIFSAHEGVFMGEIQKLSLIKDVKIKGYGYTLETDRINGNIETHKLDTETPIKIYGDKGILTAGQFSMSGLQGLIVLSKGVKVHLYPQNKVVEKEMEMK